MQVVGWHPNRFLVQPRRKIKPHIGIVGENEIHVSLNSVNIAENDNSLSLHTSEVAQFLLRFEATTSISTPPLIGC